MLVLEAGLRIDRAQAVENWRNMPFDNRVGSDFQGLYPQSAYATAPLYFPPNDYVALSGPSADSFKQGYLRTVGGTTWHWAASCWRHLPNDFKMKTLYGVGRDWPIAYDDLEPYYCRAEEAIGVAAQTIRPNNRLQRAASLIPWIWCPGPTEIRASPKWSTRTVTAPYRSPRAQHTTMAGAAHLLRQQ